MTNPAKMHLKVSICEDGKHAQQQGFVYRPPVFKPIELQEIVVIKRGTVQGHSTLDFVLEAADGQKYVFMTTANLLKIALQETQ